MNDIKRDAEMERLATRIADDEPVDWSLASRARALSGLREVEQLANGFRKAQLVAHRHAPRPSGLRWGALTLLEPIGGGGEGDIWRAYDPALDLQVALKLRKLASDRLTHLFLEEARRLARVRHTNIVSVYGAAVHEGRAGLWMELVRGAPLSGLLNEGGVFAPEDVRGIAQDLCHALAAMHRHGLVHGDVKAANVMREVSGRIVLMDLGSSSELDAPASPVVSGSLNYLAPEVLRGAPPSPAADIHALGVLLFRLLTGAYPYAADDAAGMIDAQDRGVRGRLVALRPSLPKDLVRAIERAMEREPGRRHASVLAFAAALAPTTRRFEWRLFAAVGVFVSVLAIAAGLVAGRWSATPVWQPQVQFYRADAQGANTPLTDGASVALGDRLSLEFRSSREAYVYVFDEDASGQAAVLFPLADLQLANPLAADTAYRLPGRLGGTTMSWQVSRGTSQETFVVLATDAPQPQVERAMAAWQHAEAPGAIRGVLGLVAAPQEASTDETALTAILDAAEKEAGPEHMRRWRFVFPQAAR